jgi:peptide/nickel transport system ATP-binding protein
VSATDGAAANRQGGPEPGEPQRHRRAVSAEDTLLTVRGLEVYFPIKSGILFDRVVGWVKAVDGVDLDVPRGSTVGLVGESGCGKTTLGRSVLRLVEPTGGTVTFDGIDVGSLVGEDLRRIRRRMQMIFQDPMASLDPRQSVESVLNEPRRAHGIERAEATTVARLLDLVGLPASAASRYPHEFSGGQRQRIGIARAIALEPELIIADEPVSALDVSIQAQVVNLLEELQDRLGLTYVVIAHDLAVVRHIADVVAVMYLGGIVEQAPSDALYTAPYHPYTKALMSAVPIPDPIIEDTRQRILLTGDLPSPANPPTGCRFHTRCPYRQPTRCDDERPLLRAMSPGHTVACHWAEQIYAGAIQPRASAVVEAAVPDEAPPPVVAVPGDPDVTTLGPPSGV